MTYFTSQESSSESFLKGYRGKRQLRLAGYCCRRLLWMATWWRNRRYARVRGCWSSKLVGVGWTWPDDTGHIWESLSPHLSCIPKYL